MTTTAAPVELCYKCTQSRRLISAKLANFNPSQPNADYLSEYHIFEDYLNSSNPLCSGCYNQTTSTPKHKVLAIKQPEPSSPYIFVTLSLLFITIVSLSMGLLVYSGRIIVDWNQVNNVFDEAIILYNSSIEQVAELISEQEALNTLQILYLTVFVIQLTVMLFHKTTCTSVVTFLSAVGLQYITEYKPELMPSYITSTMVLTSKLTLLLWSTVSAATSKRIVVKSYKISPVKCPVKVRHSPNRTPEKRRYRAPLAPPQSILNSLNMSAEDDISNKENSAAHTACNTAPTPIKDVFSKLNIFGCSPAKTKRPAALNGDTAYSKSLSSLSPHGSPKLPARGQLHPPKFTLNQEPKETVKKPRFDSYCDGEDDEAERVEEEILEHVELAGGNVTMRPVIALLVLSVMVNFYLCLQYVLQ